MADTCCATATQATSDYTSNYQCILSQAREACSDALAELAVTDLSPIAGNPQSRPDYWVGHLQYLLAYLLFAIEQAES